MSAWAAGLEGLGGAIDVVMPGNIRDEVASIASAYAGLDRIIQAQASTLEPAFVREWNALNAEWQRFATAHSSWLDNLWYKSYQKALEYRARLDVWRVKLEAITGRPVGFPGLGPAPGPSMTSPLPGFPFKKLLYVGGGVAAVFALSRLLKSGTEFKREMVGDRPLVAPRELVRNPPPWVLDADIWESAKLAIEPYAARYDNPLATTTHVYKQMGGRVG